MIGARMRSLAIHGQLGGINVKLGGNIADNGLWSGHQVIGSKAHITNAPQLQGKAKPVLSSTEKTRLDEIRWGKGERGDAFFQWDCLGEGREPFALGVGQKASRHQYSTLSPSIAASRSASVGRL